MRQNKLFTAILILALCLSSLFTTVSAVKFGDVQGVPKAFWPLWSTYEAALAEGNSAAIAKNGEAVINYWLNGASAEKRAAEWIANVSAHGYEINQVWSVSRKAADHYERLGDIQGLLRMNKVSLAFVDPFKALIPSIGGNTDDMEFARTLIQNKIAVYEVEAEVYAELRDGTGEVSHHGAKHEPASGIIFGEPPGAAMVLDSPQQPGSTIIYVLFENENMEARVNNDLALNRDRGYNTSDYYAVQVAWNFVNEGASLGGIPGETAKITEAAKYLASLNIPILLRVGAEMNVWEIPANPGEFIAAFRHIANIMHQNASNVALVWSVNSISAQGLTYDMFYPGDEYVDWVGMSLYSSKYFLGNHNADDVAAAIYGTGKYANPVAMMRGIVEQYGSRKPIMIAEGAVSLYNRSNGEDLTDWALPRIRQTYAYIPVLFPQVKAMYWFNVNLNGTQSWHFDISPSAKSLYGQLTASDYFIGKGESKSTVSYKKLGTASMPANLVNLITYAPYFSMDNIVVQYRLNGNWISQSADIPYRSSLDLSGEADGTHKLSIHVLAGETVLTSNEYSLHKSGSTVTISSGGAAPAVVSQPVSNGISAVPTAARVTVNGTAVAFDAYEINGNNYFKLRDLAFSLNGSAKQFGVTWDDAANAIALTSGAAYTAVGGEMASGNAASANAVPTSASIVINGGVVSPTAYEIASNNFFKLRDIGEAFNFGVEWDDANNCIMIDTGKGYSAN